MCGEGAVGRMVSANHAVDVGPLYPQHIRSKPYSDLHGGGQQKLIESQVLIFWGGERRQLDWLMASSTP